MEPKSNSQRQEPTGDTDEEGDATYLCRVCQRRIPPTADPQRREQLVHRECLAELRCGISLGDPGTRHSLRRRDHDTG